MEGFSRAETAGVHVLRSRQKTPRANSLARTRPGHPNFAKTRGRTRSRNLRFRNYVESAGEARLSFATSVCLLCKRLADWLDSVS